MIKRFASFLLAVWIVALMSLVSPAFGHHKDGHGQEPTPTPAESVEPTASPAPSPSPSVPRVPSCPTYWVTYYFGCFG